MIAKSADGLLNESNPLQANHKLKVILVIDPGRMIAKSAEGLLNEKCAPEANHELDPSRS